MLLSFVYQLVTNSVCQPFGAGLVGYGGSVRVLMVVKMVYRPTKQTRQWFKRRLKCTFYFQHLHSLKSQQPIYTASSRRECCAIIFASLFYIKRYNRRMREQSCLTFKPAAEVVTVSNWHLLEQPAWWDTGVMLWWRIMGETHQH